MHYNWHRHYDPSLGRYTQPDPLGFVDGPSVYGYAKGSPLVRVDRNGRNVAGGVIIGGTVGGPPGAVIGGVITGGLTLGCLLNPSACQKIVDWCINQMAGPDDGGSNSGGGKSKSDEPASEETAEDIAKQIERDLGRKARRDFHDLKDGGDRTLEELKLDAEEVYERYGKKPPKWMRF